MTPRRHGRRTFLGRAAGALAAGLAAPATTAFAQTPGASLAERFPDLRRHFIFEYYPWYGGPPDYEHWEYQSRNPPYDIGAPHVPLLGPYDVRSTAVLEQHARWINESGAGAIALSWWGRNSFEHRAVDRIMDVMKDHDIKVTFALEPYADDRGRRFRDDIRLLIREFGERRGYDAFLVLRNTNGDEGPIFKGFRCILPAFGTDCQGKTNPVSDYTPDHVWREQIDALRDDFRKDFDHLTILADSLEFARTPASGFDGIGIYDNFIGPELYAGIAAGASQAGLVFSLNINPGYDQIEPRERPADPCYAPRDFAPGAGRFDWAQPSERERASALSLQRIEMSFRQAIAVQQDPLLTNHRRGFCAVHINSFNEWHEGHAFEPMRDAKDLLPEERPFGYHNPENGKARLTMLTRMMGSVLPSRTARSTAPAIIGSHG
jgi:Glycosyl hydrolase family 99